MFYQTVLQYVGNGGAIDVQGKRLSFIGYLQVQAGDSVWTDGKIIFGNVPPKGSSNILDDSLKVPILGDELCGYITKTGKYKKYPIAEEDTEWTVNDKKNFEYGNSENLLDAEISKFTDENEKNILYSANSTKKHSIVNFYKNNDLVETIDLSENFNIAEQYGTNKANEIVNTDSNRFQQIVSDSTWSYYGYSQPANINKSQILGLRIDDEGNCHAIVACWYSSSFEVLRYYSAKNYDFYHKYESNHYRVGDPSTESFLANLPHVPDLIDDIINRITDIYEETYIFDYTSNPKEGYSRTRSSKARPIFSCYSYVLAYFKNWNLEKIIDYDYFQTFFKVTDRFEDGLIESATPTAWQVGTSRYVFGASLGWHTTEVYEDTEDITYYDLEEHEEEFYNSGFVKSSLFNIFTFPLQDGYTAKMTVWQIKAIYDKEGKKICGELPILDTSAYMASYFAYENEGNVDVDWQLARRTYINEQIFTGKWRSEENKQCGFYYYLNRLQDYLMPNVSITKLSKTKYLIGVHGGNLYLSENGEIKKIINETDWDNLKNFRLRELKSIKKAKAKSSQ